LLFLSLSLSCFSAAHASFKAVHYGVDVNAPTAQRRLDYEQIRKLAKANRPAIIIAGSRFVLGRVGVAARRLLFTSRSRFP
jgi:glycine/serine hydroxymethyltransferase